ncbi:MAG: NfeD family protein, partial [bacterium]|nr:NfeD family protein [bacterium]
TRHGVNGGHVSFRVVAKYGLLQLPALALLVFALIVLQGWIEISPSFFWGIIFLWIVKDVVMFPFVWRAYDGTTPGYETSLKGARGVAREPLEPEGYVQVQGVLWKSQVTGENGRLAKGASVRVRDLRGQTLLVEPAQEGEE